MSNDTQVAEHMALVEEYANAWRDWGAREDGRNGMIAARAAVEASARQLAEQGAPANSVKIPTGEDEAALMVLTGMAWLKDNAPHRLKQPEQGAPQADALYFDAAMPPVVAKWLSDHPPTNMVPLTASPTAPTAEQSSVVEPVRSMPAEPVAYSVTCNGKHVKNVFAEWEHANEKMLNLNMHYPQDKRAVVPLFATPPPAPVLSDAEIRRWWSSENGLEDKDMCKIDDFTAVVRAVEAEVIRRGGGQS